MQVGGFANGSWPLFRMFRIEVRIHWTLLVLALFVILQHLDHQAEWWWIPLLILTPFVSVLLHEFGHSLTARAVGGDSRQIIMWMFGGLAMCQVPHSPGKRFLVTAMGPVVTLVIAALCSVLVGAVPPPFGGDDFYYQAADRFGAFWPVFTSFAIINTYLLLFNLLPCYPLDGGSMLRSILWPIVGLPRAIIGTIYTAYVCLAGLFLYCIYSQNLFLGVMVLFLGYTVVQEHRLAKMGVDPYTGGHFSGFGEDTWLDRRRREQAIKAREREAHDQAEIERELDRLLEKVSQEGLPSLTTKERKFLDAYSKRQRD